jgi:gliding motility-associated-like protein
MEDRARCGDGEVLFTATTTNANIVEFSSDNGQSILSTDNTSPYQQSVMLNAGESIELWAKGINSVTGCESSWDNNANGIANPSPVTGLITRIDGSGGNSDFFDIACRNETHSYGIGLTPGSEYTWNIEALGVTNFVGNTIDAHWDVTQGQYQISVQETSASGCEGSISTASIWISDPHIFLGNDTTLCGETSIEINVAGFKAYEWSTGATNSSITLTPESGTISLTVTDTYGCQASDNITITKCNQDTLFNTITNTFTPDGDGVHDKWVINQIDLYPNAKIEVFDKWGRLVFSSDGNYAGHEWDGTSRGKELPMDTYYYIIDFKADGIKTRKGTVTIVR